MEYVTYGLFALAGGLVSHLFFNSGPGPFEKTLWYGLYQGKRVVVSVDDEAFIFEMIDKRLRITRGISQLMEDPYAGIVADDMANINGGKSTDSSEISLPHGKR